MTTNSKETHKNVNQLENGCTCQKASTSQNNNVLQSENGREKTSSSQNENSREKTSISQYDHVLQSEKDCQNNNVSQNVKPNQNTSIPQNQEQFQVPEILRGKTFLDPTYDSSFKELFSDKKILIHFLNGILHLEGETAITDIEYRDPAYGFGLPYSKMVRFDVRAITKDEKTFDIEMQRSRHSDFEDRAVLYSAMLTVSAKMDLDQGFLYKFF